MDIHTLPLNIFPNDAPRILLSLLLLLGVGLACLDEVLDSAGEASRRFLLTAASLDSALLDELRVSLRFLRRRVGLDVCA